MAGKYVGGRFDVKGLAACFRIIWKWEIS